MNINSAPSDLAVTVYYLHWSLISFTEDSLRYCHRVNNIWNKSLYFFLNKLYFLMNILYFNKLIHVERKKEIQCVYYQIFSCILVISLKKISFKLGSIKANVSKLVIVKISSNSYLTFHNFTSRNDAKTIYNIPYPRIVDFYIGITSFYVKREGALLTDILAIVLKAVKVNIKVDLKLSYLTYFNDY